MGTTKKAQKVKNQTRKNQKRKINLKMVKINQKTKNQKLQHQQERMANGKNVKSLLVSWEVQLNVLSIPVILPVTMDPIQKVLRRPNVSRTPIKLSPGARILVLVALICQKMMKKNQKMVKTNQKTEKTNQKMEKTNQKPQHQPVKMVNGKNVKSSLELWVVPSNVLLIPVLSLVMMDLSQMDPRRPNVLRTLIRLSLGVRLLVHVAPPTKPMVKTKLNPLKTKLIPKIQAARMSLE